MHIKFRVLNLMARCSLNIILGEQAWPDSFLLCKIEFNFPYLLLTTDKKIAQKTAAAYNVISISPVGTKGWFGIELALNHRQDWFRFNAESTLCACLLQGIFLSIFLCQFLH